jgi:hypothetical protein
VTRNVGGVTTSTGTTIEAGALALTLSVGTGDGAVRTASGQAPQLSVVRDRAARVAGGGLAAGSELRVWLPLDGDGARPVAVLRAGADGRFAGDLPFDGLLDRDVDRRPFPVGRHVLQLVGRGADGQLVVVEKTVRILQPGPNPERDRNADVLPRVQVGAASATRAGLPEGVRVTPDPESREARIEGDTWRIAISLATGGGTVTSSGAGGARVEVTLDETAAVTGDGFLPGTRADVWLFSEPVLLGSYTVGLDGTFRGEAPVTGVPIGEHTLQLQGIGEDGYVRSANLGVLVIPQASIIAAPTETVQVITAVQSPPERRTPWLAIALIGLVIVALLRRGRQAPRPRGLWLITRSRIEYDVNGGSGSVEAAQGIAGRRIELSGVDLSGPDGGTLLGWSTDPQASEPAYGPGNRVRLQRGTTTLYAVWGAPVSGAGAEASAHRESGSPAST